MNSLLNKIKAYSGFFGAFSIIAILAFAFHYPIWIIDALTSEPVTGFGIKISAWRLIFEPFTGPLLFYLRADQPLLEFIVLIIWIISLSLIISFVSTLLFKKTRGISAVLYKFLPWLKKTPLIFSIWLGLLLVIIFLNLPANTITNNLEDTILINTHSHTEYSHDGIISTEDLLKWHGYHRFDAFFITDHNHHEKTLEAVKAQDEGTLPPSPLIIAGEEFSGSNHMTLLGLRRNFITRSLSDQQVIDSTHENNGVVIVAHWFDGERKSIPYFIKMGVDGFEIANQNTGLSYDRRIFNNIKKACNSHGLIMNGAADYHGYGSTCFVWNALEIQGWHKMDNNQKREAILDVLRLKDMSKIKVLLYNDRKVFDRAQVSLSPVYTIISYFRTLNFLQVLSWFFWVIIIKNIRLSLLDRNRFKQLNIGALKVLEILSFLSSLFILTLGFILHDRSQNLVDYNDIYSEYGTIMIWSGTGFLIYLMVLIIFEIRVMRLKRNHIKNK
ncbi:hypothetical protein ES708_07733 [subsurface metagenome]